MYWGGVLWVKSIIIIFRYQLLQQIIKRGHYLNNSIPDGTPVHTQHPVHLHLFTPRAHLTLPVHLPAFLWPVEENHRT